MIRLLVREYREAFRGLPREVWLLSCAALITRAGTMVLPLLALYLTEARGFGVGAASRVVALYGLGGMIGALAGGALSDRFGPVRVQVATLAGAGAAMLAIPAAPATPLSIAAIVALSLISEPFRPAMMAAVAEHATPGTITRSLALLRLALNVGMAIGPAAGGILALWRFDLVFVADAATCWLAALFLALALGRRQRATPQSERRGDPAGDWSMSPWRDGPFLALLVVVFGQAVIFFQLLTTYPVFLVEHYGYTTAGVGALLAINAVVIALVEMIAVKRLEGAPALILVGVGCALIGIGIGIVGLGASLGVAIASILVFTAGEILALPFVNAVVARRAGPGRSGRYMGMFTLAFSAAFVLGPAIGGAVYERFGPGALWAGCALAGVVLGAACVPLRTWHRATLPSPACGP